MMETVHVTKSQSTVQMQSVALPLDLPELEGWRLWHAKMPSKLGQPGAPVDKPWLPINKPCFVFSLFTCIMFACCRRYFFQSKLIVFIELLWKRLLNSVLT